MEDKLANIDCLQVQADASIGGGDWKFAMCVVKIFQFRGVLTLKIEKKGCY
jgi:hypothetical protein